MCIRDSSISYTGSAVQSPGDDVCYTANVTAGTNPISSIQATIRNSSNVQTADNERSVSVSSGSTENVSWCSVTNSDDPFSSYQWYTAKVKDNAGNETSYSDIVQEGGTTVNSSNPIFSRSTSVLTLADNTAPTFTGSISVSNIEPMTADISWPSASDNVGVSYYKIFVDGQFITNANGNSWSLSVYNLGSADTTYNVEVQAVDSAGNTSSLTLSLIHI